MQIFVLHILGPGHVYRLYSSAFFDQHMIAHQDPEIVQTPLEDLLLQLRVLGIDNIESFPFPSSPPLSALRRAILLLTYLGAFASSQSITSSLFQLDSSLSISVNNDVKKKSLKIGKVTSVGDQMAKFPINPRYAKMLVIAKRTGKIS